MLINEIYIGKYIHTYLQKKEELPHLRDLQRKFKVSKRKLISLFVGSSDSENYHPMTFFRVAGVQFLEKNQRDEIRSKLQVLWKGKIVGRDGNRCILCGSMMELEIAHVIKCPNAPIWRKEYGWVCRTIPANAHWLELFGKKTWGWISTTQLERHLTPYYTPENLLTLCNHCHTRYHARHRGIVVTTMNKGKKPPLKPAEGRKILEIVLKDCPAEGR